MNNLAFVCLARKEYAKAEGLAVTALNAYKNAGTDTWHRYESEVLLGASLAGQNKYLEAEPMLLSGYAGMIQSGAKIPAGNRFKLKDAGTWIVRLYERWHQDENAKEWRQKLRHASLADSAR